MKVLTSLFRALSDETRLRILNLLRTTGELCVCDIQEVIGGPQTKISRHLAYLRKNGLVRARRSGLWMLYSVPSSPDTSVARILECVGEILGDLEKARSDNQRLIRNVREGCCATFSRVLPERKKRFLKLTKN